MTAPTLDLCGMTVKVHPAADLFPVMPDSEQRELGQDIRKHGLRQPLVFWVDRNRREALIIRGRATLDQAIEAQKERGELELLDGRNRLLAMRAVGILDRKRLAEAFKSAKLFWRDEGTPEQFVLTANLHRRHLTAEQKRNVIAALLKANPAQSDRAIAKTAKVDKNTVAAVRADAERRGEIHHVATRTDTKGRQQPAHKTVTERVTIHPVIAGQKPVTIDVTKTPIELTMPRAVLSERDKGAAFARVSEVCERAARQLREMMAAVLLMPRADRVSLAVELIDTLGLRADDLRCAQGAAQVARLEPGSGTRH